MTEKNDEFYSLSEASAYARVCRQAIFAAIKKKQLKAEKRMVTNQDGTCRLSWVILKKDLDAYRASKYNREKRVVDGEKLFDIANDKWSVWHAAKTLSGMMGKSYPSTHIYYLLRTGQLRGSKKGGAWVIRRQELVDLYNRECISPPYRIRVS